MYSNQTDFIIHKIHFFLTLRSLPVGFCFLTENFPQNTQRFYFAKIFEMELVVIDNHRK